MVSVKLSAFLRKTKSFRDNKPTEKESKISSKVRAVLLNWELNGQILYVLN